MPAMPGLRSGNLRAKLAKRSPDSFLDSGAKGTVRLEQDRLLESNDTIASSGVLAPAAGPVELRGCSTYVMGVALGPAWTPASVGAPIDSAAGGK
eukprot:9932776-Alexandrium_andersonii.AAC.1